MNYRPDSIEIERLQLALNVKAVVLRSGGRRVCGIQYDVLPDGVVNFAPDAFVCVRYYGSHYERSVDSSGRKSFQYDEFPAPIRGRLVGQGFYAVIACVPKMRSRRPAQQKSGCRNPNCPTPRKTEAARVASIRIRATKEIPPRLAVSEKKATRRLISATLVK